MKILIITYNREVNPGTFLQAYGVQYFFKRLYPNAQIDLLKHKRLYSISGTRKGNKSEKKDLVWFWGKMCAIPRRLKYEWGYRSQFHFSKEEFDFFNYSPNEFKIFAEKYDLIVVGSDTILVNYQKNGKTGLMWLENICTNKVLFAASAAPAKFSLSAEESERLGESFSTFILLGVRDKVTYNLLVKRLNLKERVFRMDDPTYIIPQDCFHLPHSLMQKLAKIHREKEIAVVNFGDAYQNNKNLTNYLKGVGFYTVSTLYNRWADLNIMTLSPFEWGALFQMIDLTVTERFHDSVFTLRNNKPVVAIDWDNNRFASDGSSKTADILYRYGLSEFHCVDDGNMKVDRIMEIIERQRRNFSGNECQKINLLIQEEYKTIMKNICDRVKGGSMTSGGGKRGIKNLLRETCVYKWKTELENKRLAKKRAPYWDALKALIGDDTSIICSNCFAGRIMQDLGMLYNTPTLGLYIWYPDYIELLQNLKYYMTEAKITFVEHSKYPLGDERRARWKHWYPIGLLDGKVEIQFLHYHTKEEAAAKWYRRASRINWDKLFVIGMEQNLCTEKDIRAFDSLPYEHKVFFSTKEYSELKSCVYMEEFEGWDAVGDPYKYGHVFYKKLIKKLR